MSHVEEARTVAGEMHVFEARFCPLIFDGVRMTYVEGAMPIFEEFEAEDVAQAVERADEIRTHLGLVKEMKYDPFKTRDALRCMYGTHIRWLGRLKERVVVK